MKTVIEELIEELKANDVAHGMYWIKQPDVFFEKYLEKEKEQIEYAFKYALNMRFGNESQVNTGNE